VDHQISIKLHGQQPANASGGAATAAGPQEEGVSHYESLSILQIVQARTQWLAIFCCGLIGTAFGVCKGLAYPPIVMYKELI
jgi:hypothetical protein